MAHFQLGGSSQRRHQQTRAEQDRQPLARADPDSWPRQLLLDMGAPVGIESVAKQLIAMSGWPIQINYTGLRPGEKMHEVLASATEVLPPSAHPADQSGRRDTAGSAGGRSAAGGRRARV